MELRIRSLKRCLATQLRAVHLSKASLMMTTREFMNITSKLHAKTTSKFVKNQGDINRFFFVTLVWFTMTSFHRVKRSIRNTNCNTNLKASREVRLQHDFNSHICQTRTEPHICRRTGNESIESHLLKAPKAIHKCMENLLSVGLYVLAQKEPSSQATINICIK